MIGKLKKLKLLDLTECVDLCLDNGVFRNLVSLQELYMRASVSSPINFTDANYVELEILSQGLFELELKLFENKIQPKNVSFNELERFMISIGCKLVYLYYDGKYSYKNTMNLVGDCNELLECKINELFEKTEVLYLQVNDMIHIEHISIHPSQPSFCNLRVLDVFNCQDLTFLFKFPVANGLKKLEHLTISKCPVPKVLVCENSGVEVIKFQKLKVVSLSRLPNLISLCESENVIELPQMVELMLSGLPNLTGIYPTNNSNCEAQSILNKDVNTSILIKVSLHLVYKPFKIFFNLLFIVKVSIPS